MNKNIFHYFLLLISSLNILWLGYSSPAKADSWDQMLPQIIDIINKSQQNQNSSDGNPAPSNTIPNGQLDIEPKSEGSPSIPQSENIPVKNIPSGQILLPNSQPAPLSSNRQAVIKIYREILERDVDPSGMDTWTRELNSGKTILQVRRAIAESPEAQNKLNELYRRMLCRDIDSSGRITWTNALASGWTLQRVASEGIAPSPEYQSRGGRSCN
jgi:hypothetical protein